MILRYDRLGVVIPSGDPDPAAAMAVRELMGGRFAHWRRSTAGGRPGQPARRAQGRKGRVFLWTPVARRGPVTTCSPPAISSKISPTTTSRDRRAQRQAQGLRGSRGRIARASGSAHRRPASGRGPTGAGPLPHLPSLRREGTTAGGRHAGGDGRSRPSTGLLIAAPSRSVIPAHRSPTLVVLRLADGRTTSVSAPPEYRPPTGLRHGSHRPSWPPVTGRSPRRTSSRGPRG